MKKFYLNFSGNIFTFYKMLFILATLLIFSCSSLYAQRKLVKDKDDFSSVQTVHSKDVKIASVFPIIGRKKPWDLVMSFWKTDSAFSIIITHEDQAFSSEVADISFKFKDETIIKLDKAANTGRYNSGFGYYFTFTVFSISKDDLQKFGSVDLVKFNASLKNNADYPIVEEEFKKKISENLREDANAILAVKDPLPQPKKEIKSDFDDPCKYLIDKVDDFSKKRVVLTNSSIIYDTKVANFGDNVMNVCGSYNNGAIGLQFTRGMNYTGSGRVREEELKAIIVFDQLDLLLENDEVVSLKEKDAAQYIKNGAYYGYKTFTIDNDATWTKLKTIPLKKIRISLVGNELDTQIVDKGYVKAIMKVIKCIDMLGISKSK